MCEVGVYKKYMNWFLFLWTYTWVCTNLPLSIVRRDMKQLFRNFKSQLRVAVTGKPKNRQQRSVQAIYVLCQKRKQLQLWIPSTFVTLSHCNRRAEGPAIFRKVSSIKRSNPTRQPGSRAEVGPVCAQTRQAVYSSMSSLSRRNQGATAVFALNPLTSQIYALSYCSNWSPS